MINFFTKCGRPLNNALFIWYGKMMTDNGYEINQKCYKNCEQNNLQPLTPTKPINMLILVD